MYHLTSMIAYLVAVLRTSLGKHFPYEKELLVGGKHDVIFHGRHLDDVMCSAQGTFHHSAVLVLHTEVGSCDWGLQDFMQSWDKLPPATRDAIVLFTHDYMLTPEAVWHDMTRFRLDTRYELVNCLDIVVFKAGQLCHNDFIKMKNFRDHEELISMLTVSVDFLNAHSKPVTVRYLRISGSDVAHNVTVAPNGTAVVHGVPPVVCLARESRTSKFINGWIFNTSSTTTVIHPSLFHADEIAWRSSLKEDRLADKFTFQSMRYSHAYRYYNTLTQAAEVENLTDTGFGKRRIPRDVYQDIMAFLREHENDFSSEYYPREFTFWNLDEVDITQVTFNSSLASAISARLRPTVEAWCRCLLEETRGPGIVTRLRRYPRTSMVRFHVDERETNHVIGAILHLARKLDYQRDWPLVLIGFDGQPVSLTMAPGEMVLFEASKVIHGRPMPLQGEYYINTFFYYHPRQLKGNQTLQTGNQVKPTHTVEL